MARWADVEAAEPEFAAAVRAKFDAYRHKVMATLRRDGSPRVSGIEVTFSDGEVWFGSMPGARKLADLARDPRLALHCTSDDPPDDPTLWSGDAKLSGRAIEVDDPERLKSMGDGSGDDEESTGDVPGYLFRVDISEVVLTKVGDPPDHLAIGVWTLEGGLRQLKSQ
ncbi:MAG TPA: pyridoxamine 5'-phosphate oxidase family protein [Dehalococcoidia bacterium]|nr:pyridoxamine 5'-phosphate oxidase family protein [Dehalococcoidia bacterium]